MAACRDRLFFFRLSPAACHCSYCDETCCTRPTTCMCSRPVGPLSASMSRRRSSHRSSMGNAAIVGTPSSHNSATRTLENPFVFQEVLEAGLQLVISRKHTERCQRSQAVGDLFLGLVPAGPARPAVLDDPSWGSHCPPSKPLAVHPRTCSTSLTTATRMANPDKKCPRHGAELQLTNNQPITTTFGSVRGFARPK